MTAILRHPHYPAGRSGRYRTGLCAEAAIALARLTGLKLGFVGVEIPDDDGEPGTTIFVPHHAIVFVDKTQSIWADAYGIFAGADEFCFPEAPNAKPVFRPALGETDVAAAFSMTAIDEAEVAEASLFLRADGWIGRMQAAMAEMAPPSRPVLGR